MSIRHAAQIAAHVLAINSKSVDQQGSGAVHVNKNSVTQQTPTHSKACMTIPPALCGHRSFCVINV